jgi:hypothetical protein
MENVSMISEGSGKFSLNAGCDYCYSSSCNHYPRLFFDEHGETKSTKNLAGHSRSFPSPLKKSQNGQRLVNIIPSSKN